MFIVLDTNLWTDQKTQLLWDYPFIQEIFDGQKFLLKVGSFIKAIFHSWKLVCTIWVIDFVSILSEFWLRPLPIFWIRSTHSNLNINDKMIEKVYLFSIHVWNFGKGVWFKSLSGLLWNSGKKLWKSEFYFSCPNRTILLTEKPM